MPGFTYVVVDKKGKEKKGNIEADTREKVIDILKNDGLIPVSVKEQGALNKDIDFSIGKKVKPRDPAGYSQSDQSAELRGTHDYLWYFL